MAIATLSRDELIDRLLGVFRDRGFEGATVAEISRATGLGKASLYHHFPGGKHEMAEVVTREVCERLTRQAYTLLNGATHPGSPGTRIGAFIKALDDYFEGGTRNCLLAMMAMGTAHGRLDELLQQQHAMWLDMLAATLAEAGSSRKQARRQAREFLVRLHGAAVLARLLNDTKPFRQTLKQLHKDVRD